jgi:hypothetical protein
VAQQVEQQQVEPQKVAQQVEQQVEDQATQPCCSTSTAAFRHCRSTFVWQLPRVRANRSKGFFTTTISLLETSFNHKDSRRRCSSKAVIAQVREVIRRGGSLVGRSSDRVLTTNEIQAGATRCAFLMCALFATAKAREARSKKHI